MGTALCRLSKDKTLGQGLHSVPKASVILLAVQVLVRMLLVYMRHWAIHETLRA